MTGEPRRFRHKMDSPAIPVAVVRPMAKDLPPPPPPQEPPRLPADVRRQPSPIQTTEAPPSTPDLYCWAVNLLERIEKVEEEGFCGGDLKRNLHSGLYTIGKREEGIPGRLFTRVNFNM